MDEEAQEILIPSDLVAERTHAYCNLMAQIERISPRDKDLRTEALKFAEAVRLTITPKQEKATLSAIKGGAAPRNRFNSNLCVRAAREDLNLSNPPPLIPPYSRV